MLSFWLNCVRINMTNYRRCVYIVILFIYWVIEKKKKTGWCIVYVYWFVKDIWPPHRLALWLTARGCYSHGDVASYLPNSADFMAAEVNTARVFCSTSFPKISAVLYYHLSCGLCFLYWQKHSFPLHKWTKLLDL